MNMQEVLEKIEELKKRLKEIKEILAIETKKLQLTNLENKMQEKDFWHEQERAKNVSQQAADLKEEINQVQKLEKEIDDLLDIVKEVEGTQENDLKKDLVIKTEEIEKEINDLQFKTLLGDKHDYKNAIVAVHAGTGGTDAQDWAEMLERMILRFAEKKGFKASVLERQSGSEAGIKSSIIEISGRYSYGYLKSEAGVHRLVRISPYDAEKMRHTSFALIEVLPEIADDEDVELKDEDLQIDTFRSSGHGGQSVNTTDSAVRVKHLPTGISVSCQNERSQLQNKQTALKILKSKLEQFNVAEKEEEKKKIKGEFSEAVWGNQARSYVLHPYKMVKDHRTNYETQDVEGVLDGDLQNFVESYLKKQAQEK